MHSVRALWLGSSHTIHLGLTQAEEWPRAAQRLSLLSQVEAEREGSCWSQNREEGPWGWPVTCLKQLVLTSHRGTVYPTKLEVHYSHASRSYPLLGWIFYRHTVCENTQRSFTQATRRRMASAVFTLHGHFKFQYYLFSLTCSKS